MSVGPLPPDGEDALNHERDLAARWKDEYPHLSAAGDAGQPSFDQPAQPPLEQTAPPPLPMATCKRCGKQVDATLPRCPFCDARMPASSMANAWGDAALLQIGDAQSMSPAAHTAVTRLLIFYVLMLSTNLVAHWIGQAMQTEHLTEKAVAQRMLPIVAFVEVLDAILVVVALFVVPWPPKVGSNDPFYRRIGWLTGPLVLAVVLGLNFAYHAALESYLQFPEWMRSKIGFPIGWSIVLICVQPAIVEELFFRFIALGTLTRVMGIAGAIFVSSVMFGMAHSGVLLSIPILTVVGAGLGFVRVLSGSIVLPMLLHAVHNAVVLYIENTQ